MDLRSAVRHLFVLATLFVVTAGNEVTAISPVDSFGRAFPGIFSSSNARYGFKTLPKHATGILFTVGEDGEEQVLWKQRLVNIPVRALVAPDGQSVVTINTWADLGREHSLVVYDAKGKMLADYRLEDLLTTDEIRDHVFTTAPNRWWTADASFRFRPEGRRLARFLEVSMEWGKTITVDLTSGKITAPADN